ncbi:histidine kinase, partial [Streptomyces sp. SID11233]|nr:histidine kinase [Streptomyces sp. SID11233]
MRTRLLPLLIILLAGVLLALGFPLAISMAAGEQQKVIVDRIDDSARFASLAQFVNTDGDGAGATVEDTERSATLDTELGRYYRLYGIHVGVFDRLGEPFATAPHSWQLPPPEADASLPGTTTTQGHGASALPEPTGSVHSRAQPFQDAGEEARSAYDEALNGRRSPDPEQVWPWQTSRRLIVASPVIRDGDVIAVVVTDSPTGALRSRTLQKWLLVAVGEGAAMLLALGAALRLTGWVLR